MMFCNNCGQQIDDNMKFCTYCGTPVYKPEEESVNVAPEEPAVEPQKPEPPKQPEQSEGSTIKGTMPDYQTNYTTPSGPDRPKKSKKPLIIVGVIVVIIVVLAIIGAVANQKAKTEKTITTTTPVTKDAGDSAVTDSTTGSGSKTPSAGSTASSTGSATVQKDDGKSGSGKTTASASSTTTNTSASYTHDDFMNSANYGALFQNSVLSYGPISIAFDSDYFFDGDSVAYEDDQSAVYVYVDANTWYNTYDSANEDTVHDEFVNGLDEDSTQLSFEKFVTDGWPVIICSEKFYSDSAECDIYITEIAVFVDETSDKAIRIYGMTDALEHCQHLEELFHNFTLNEAPLTSSDTGFAGGNEDKIADK